MKAQIAPLLDPRRTILLLAQPVARSDVAAGIFAAVCGMVLLVHTFLVALLFFGLLLGAWLGAEEAGARDALAHAFEDLKKYEQLKESALISERKAAARLETAALDELGSRRTAQK